MPGWQPPPLLVKAWGRTSSCRISFQNKACQRTKNRAHSLSLPVTSCQRNRDQGLRLLVTGLWPCRRLITEPYCVSGWKSILTTQLEARSFHLPAKEKRGWCKSCSFKQEEGISAVTVNQGLLHLRMANRKQQFVQTLIHSLSSRSKPSPFIMVP